MKKKMDNQRLQAAGWILILVASPLLAACNQTESASDTGAPLSEKEYCESGRRHLSNASFIQSADVLTNETARKECNSAIADFNKVLAHNPGSLSALGGRAIAYFRTGLLQFSLNDLNSCIRQEPGKSTWHFNKSLVLEHLGRENEAFDEMKCALSLEQDSRRKQVMMSRLASFGIINSRNIW